ncbi:hypothetical protein [Kitasatospora kifunensis]|uniref:Uncharacterized protein n=1 Tax=Kitasatospora kifunensis TaxID=58351 RepID=A0A7W7RBW5_KITKI|nr:hypothetical protein [Kitasatospora kifunensis]MBB4929117.1 hypothetical protein [Kitasatospora kifunensis]
MSQAPRRKAREGSAPTARFLYGGSYATTSDRYVRAINSAASGFTDKETRVVSWYISVSPGPVPPTNGAPADLAPGVTMTAVAMAAEMGVNANALGRILRHLHWHRILVETHRVGRIVIYRISPYISCKGTAAEQRQAITRWNPPHVPGLNDPDPGAEPCKDCAAESRKPRKRPKKTEEEAA